MSRQNWTRDELLLATNLVFHNNQKALDRTAPEVLELSEFLRKFPAHQDANLAPSFRSPASVALKTRNIADKLPSNSQKKNKSNGSKSEAPIIDLFLNDYNVAQKEVQVAVINLMQNAFEELVSEEFYESSFERIEGRRKLISHYRIERNRELRNAKIREIRARDQNVCCEICGFSFFAVYGERGVNFLEVHHVNFLSESGERSTKMSELIGLCSNCHRMIHRKQPWLSPSELRILINK